LQKHRCCLTKGLSLWRADNRGLLKIQRIVQMLVLSRKLDQSIQIGDEITVTIVSIKGNTVRLGISAPDHIRVARSELQVRQSQALEAGARETPDRGRRDAAAASRKSDRCVAGSESNLQNSAWPTDSIHPLVVELQTNPDQPVSFTVSADKLESKFQRPLAGRLGRKPQNSTDEKSREETSSLEKLFPAGDYQVFQARVRQSIVDPIDLADTNCQ
jgi:carbon storage regulator